MSRWKRKERNYEVLWRRTSETSAVHRKLFTKPKAAIQFYDKLRGGSPRVFDLIITRITTEIREPKVKKAA